MLQVKELFDSKTSTWSYILYEKTSNKCAIIDPVLDFDIFSGSIKTDSADQIINFIKEYDLELEWIIETNIHADHISSSQYMKKSLGGKVAISNHVLDIIPTWQKIFNTIDTPQDGSQFDYLFKDDEIFKIGNLEVKIIHTPGHTPVDSCFIIEDNIFVGDAIFMPDIGAGRCDFPGGSAKSSYESCQKIFSYPDNYKLDVGHDYPPNNSRQIKCQTTILEQKNSNIRLNKKISKEEFITKREKGDKEKEVPKLLLPSLQINLRAGSFGKKDQLNNQYLKIPLNLF